LGSHRRLGLIMRILGVTASGVIESGDFELIASTILTSSESSITFGNLNQWSSTYKHLQIRYLSRESSTGANTFMRLNNDSGNNYSEHQLYGDGSGIGSTATSSVNKPYIGSLASSSDPTGVFAAGVVDLLDPFSTSKNKTVRTFSGNSPGATASRYIFLRSFAYYSTASLTSITVLAQSADFVTGSRFSLYGIKG